MNLSKIALLSFAYFGIVGAATTHAADRPNVIVFLVDDMGVMDTSLPGADESFYETPNLERLAAQGMTFRNGYCAHPRCVESRFGIQTGRSPYRDGAQISNTGKAMAPHLTIGEAFQKRRLCHGVFREMASGQKPAGISRRTRV